MRVAEECVSQAKHVDDPRVLAYYQATLANAAALDGDRRTATASLAASQASIERVAGTPGDSWASHYSTGRWAHEAGMILVQLGDFPSAQEHLHHALASWCDFLDCADGIRSVKIRDAVHDMRARLHRLRGTAGAEEINERAAAFE